MDNKQTSDERLLNLIEGSQDPSRKQNIRPAFKKPTAGIFPFKFNLNSLKALKGIKVNLSGLNRGLIGVSCLLTLIFIYNIFSGPVVSKSNAAYFSPADATAVSKIISAVQAQGLIAFPDHCLLPAVGRNQRIC